MSLFEKVPLYEGLHFTFVPPRSDCMNVKQKEKEHVKDSFCFHILVSYIHMQHREIYVLINMTSIRA